MSLNATAFNYVDDELEYVIWSLVKVNNERFDCQDQTAKGSANDPENSSHFYSSGTGLRCSSVAIVVIPEVGQNSLLVTFYKYRYVRSIQGRIEL